MCVVCVCLGLTQVMMIMKPLNETSIVPNNHIAYVYPMSTCPVAHNLIERSRFQACHLFVDAAACVKLSFFPNQSMLFRIN